MDIVEKRYRPPRPTFVFQSFEETDEQMDASLRQFTQGKPPNATIHTVRMVFS